MVNLSPPFSLCCKSFPLKKYLCMRKNPSSPQTLCKPYKRQNSAFSTPPNASAGGQKLKHLKTMLKNPQTVKYFRRPIRRAPHTSASRRIKPSRSDGPQQYRSAIHVRTLTPENVTLRLVTPPPRVAQLTISELPLTPWAPYSNRPERL